MENYSKTFTCYCGNARSAVSIGGDSQKRVKCDLSCVDEGRLVNKMSGWFTAEAVTHAKAREEPECSPALRDKPRGLSVDGGGWAKDDLLPRCTGD